MRFKLLCFIVPLKVAFAITLQYLAINISDTPWVSGTPHSCSEWACCLGSWSPIISLLLRLVLEKEFLKQRQTWRGAKSTPRSQEILVPGFVSATVTDPQTWASEFSLAKGKDSIQWPLRPCLMLRLWDSIRNDQHEEQSPSHGLDLDEFGY